MSVVLIYPQSKKVIRTYGEIGAAEDRVIGVVELDIILLQDLEIREIGIHHGDPLLLACNVYISVHTDAFEYLQEALEVLPSKG
jgi:hypothetical protein